MKGFLAEAGWVLAGQAGLALGTVVGVRILTQFLAPDAYGVVSLSTGLSLLTISLVATPLTQAAIHFYPAIAANGTARELMQSLLRCLRQTAPWVILGALAAGSAYVVWGHGSVVLVVLLTLLLASDCWRTANLSLLNAARRQRTYALWTAADAWSRPLAASVVVLLVGQSPMAVIGAYVLVSAVLVVVFSRGLWPESPRSAAVTHDARRARDLDAKMWSYAVPLLPLGIIAWASNLGDRYVIGGVLGIADAGLYAAVYGLSSMPFTIVTGAAEQALRPIYQSAVTHGERLQARRVLLLWLAIIIGVCTAGVLLFTFGHALIASYLVGKSYRHASGLMPLIATGYAIRAVSYVFERVCYAYGRTRRVLFIQLWAVAATAVATPLGILNFGLQGAATAVPIYFTIQLAVAIFLARRTLSEASAEPVSVGDVPLMLQRRA